MAGTNRIDQMRRVQEEGLQLFKKKNKDYGDSFATYGSVGVIVRIGDKINRLGTVTKNGVTLVNTESVRDTLIDLHNYAAMAIMLLDESNKQETNPLSDAESDPQSSVDGLVSQISDTEQQAVHLSTQICRQINTLEKFIATRQAHCSHQFQITPPSILGYGSAISPQYCTKCELGLGNYNDIPLNDDVPSASDIKREKQSYFALKQQYNDLQSSLHRLRETHKTLLKSLQAHCTHVWRHRGGGSGCYGYEDRERYCTLCGLC